MAFEYKSLDTARSEIRLLRLRPAASFDEPLRVSIFHASLDESPEYEALSYVWGKTWGEFTVLIEDGQDVKMDGTDDTNLPTLPITPNLDTALRHVRFQSTQSAKDRILWVDALCINQKDPVERSRQVQQMRRIYETCIADVAFLGPHPSSPLTEKKIDDMDSDNEEGRAAQEVEAIDGETEEQLRERKLAAKREWKRVKAEERRVRMYKRRARYLRDGLTLMRQVADRDVTALSSMVQNWNKQTGWFYRYDKSDDEEEDEEEGVDENGNKKKKEKPPPKDEYDPENPKQKRYLTSTQVSSLNMAFSLSKLWSRVWIVQELSCAPKVLLGVGKPFEGELGREEEEHGETKEGKKDSDAVSLDSLGGTTVVVGRKGGNETENGEQEAATDNLDTIDWDRDIVGGFLNDAAYADAFHSSWGHGSVGPAAARIFSRVRSIQVQRQLIRSRGKLGSDKGFIGRHRPLFKEESELERQISRVGGDEEASSPSALDPSLINVLARFKWTMATDARDKVYGLLGLVAEAPHLPPVDYTQPVSRVYSDAALAIIETSGNLDVISQNPFDGEDGWTGYESEETKRGEHGRAPNLPSWAPNFDRSFYTDYYDEFATILFAQRGIYAAGKPDCRQLLPLKTGDGTMITKVKGEDKQVPFTSIRLRGAVLGRVAPLKQGPWEEEGHKYVNSPAKIELFRRQKKLYFDDMNYNDNDIYGPTNEPRWEAFWRTIVGDCTAYPIRRLTAEERAQSSAGLLNMCRLREEEIQKEEEETKNLTTDEEWEKYRLEKRYTPYPPSVEAADKLVVGEMLRRMVRRLGMAETLKDSSLPSGGGLMLMVRALVEPGDLVAIVDGSKVPVVLRAQDVTIVGGNDDTVHYKYVCPAYVHGYMDGEAVAQVADGKLREQDFVLV